MSDPAGFVGLPTILLPQGPGGALAEAITQAGFPLVCAPLTTHHALAIEENKASSLLDNLYEGSFDWFILTSKRTLRLFALALGISEDDMARTLAAMVECGTKIASVGPATTASVHDFGLGVDYEATVHTGLGLAEELLALGGTAKHPPAHTAFAPGSARSTGVLPQTLQAGGWHVCALPVYDTLTVPTLPPAFLQALAGDAGPGSCVFVATSGSNAQAACELIPEHLRPAVVAVGEPSAHACLELGLDLLGVASAPHNIADTLRTIRPRKGN
ncbi:MAG: uroporphyrinogen-III synthase [Actinomycetaceae bacterium]|nr:uroporphyrinogen-III synthase [Actinomycetaceae bacterium]